MTAADPYVTVRRRILDDETGFFGPAGLDHELLGWWLELRIRADAAWPATASLPRDCPETVIDRLARGAAVAIYPGDRYRMPDYDLEREGRATRGAAGGKARARAAKRDSTGQYQRVRPANAGRERSTSDAQPLNASQPNASQTDPPPPAERGSRANGSSLRAVGRSPRDRGSNPRATGASPRQRRAAEKRGGGDALAAIVGGFQARDAGEMPDRRPLERVGAVLAAAVRPAEPVTVGPGCFKDAELFRAHAFDRRQGPDGAWSCEACEPPAIAADNARAIADVAARADVQPELGL